MTKKQFELASKVNRSDCCNAFDYLNTILNKFAQLLEYHLKHDTYFKKLNPKLQKDYRIISLDISYKKGKRFTMYIVISKSFVYLCSNPYLFEKDKWTYYLDTLIFCIDYTTYLSNIQNKIENLKKTYREMSF